MTQPAREIVWAAGALDDLDRHVAWIAADHPAAALDVVDRIGATVENLAFLPAGRRGRVPGTYEMPVRGLPYIVAYALAPRPAGGERLVVLRVIHGARNWPEGGWPG